jgi:hypothetical protein
MGNHVQILQATSLEERAATARDFVQATRLEVGAVFVDGNNDEFMNLLSAHPQRFFVIDAAGVLQLIAMPFEGEYSLRDVDQCLSEICPAQS